MVRGASSIAVLAVLLSGCAGEGPPTQSFIGLTSLAHSEEIDDEPSQDSAAIIKRVPSNKVLGAMAFQKATGRTVDATRLSNTN